MPEHKPPYRTFDAYGREVTPPGVLAEIRRLDAEKKPKPMTTGELHRLTGTMDADIPLYVGDEPVTDWRGEWREEKKALVLYLGEPS